MQRKADVQRPLLQLDRCTSLDLWKDYNTMPSVYALGEAQLVLLAKTSDEMSA